MIQVRVVSINILNDLSLWHLRRNLIVDQLFEMSPDLIGLQEVSLKDGKDNAHWLTDSLNQKISSGNPYEVYICPKTGKSVNIEGIAILSRLPVKRHTCIDLETQSRVAQCVEIFYPEKTLLYINTHLFWQPGESTERLRQIERIIGWIGDCNHECPVIIGGDFNGTPDSKAIARLYHDFTSAHVAKHQQEPAYTASTPLPRSKIAIMKTIIGFLVELRPFKMRLGWHGTLDYIFFNHLIKTIDCQVVFNKPLSDNPRIYPSDHYGLMADLEI